MGGDSCQAPAHVSASHTIREAGGFLRLTALEMESQRICLAVRFQDGLLRPPPGLLDVVCCPLSTYVQGTRVHDVLIKRGSRPYTDGSSPRATQGRSARRPAPAATPGRRAALPKGRVLCRRPGIRHAVCLARLCAVVLRPGPAASRHRGCVSTHAPCSAGAQHRRRALERVSDMRELRAGSQNSGLSLSSYGRGGFNHG